MYIIQWRQSVHALLPRYHLSDPPFAWLHGSETKLIDKCGLMTLPFACLWMNLTCYLTWLSPLESSAVPFSISLSPYNSLDSDHMTVSRVAIALSQQRIIYTCYVIWLGCVCVARRVPSVHVTFWNKDTLLIRTLDWVPTLYDIVFSPEIRTPH